MSAEGGVSEGEKRYMREAISLAQQGVEAGDGGPFGAVVVCDGVVVGRGWNRVVGGNDPTAHAEVEAIRDACRRLGSFSLDGCRLYVSCQPCPMCFSASYWARLDEVVYAADEGDAAAIGFDDAAIAVELGLAPGQRRLASRQLLREEALPVFALWRDKADKVPY